MPGPASGPAITASALTLTLALPLTLLALALSPLALLALALLTLTLLALALLTLALLALTLLTLALLTELVVQRVQTAREVRGLLLGTAEAVAALSLARCLCGSADALPHRLEVG